MAEKRPTASEIIIELKEPILKSYYFNCKLNNCKTERTS